MAVAVVGGGGVSVGVGGGVMITFENVLFFWFIFCGFIIGRTENVLTWSAFIGSYARWTTTVKIRCIDFTIGC